MNFPLNIHYNGNGWSNQPKTLFHGGVSTKQLIEWYVVVEQDVISSRGLDSTKKSWPLKNGDWILTTIWTTKIFGHN
jgi:hypothetical protein